MKLKRLTYKLLKLSIACLIMLSVVIPVYAETDDVAAFNEQMTKVSSLNFEAVNDLSDVREPVVYARHLYDKIEENNKDQISDDNMKNLTIAEAKVLQLWIKELLPFDSFADSGMSWVIDEQYEAISEELEKYNEDITKYVPSYSQLEEFYDKVVPQLQAKKRDDYAKAMQVEKIISNMQVLKLSDKEEAKNARKAYDALTSDQKAFVTNYELLKEAENNIAKWEKKTLPHTNPKNIIYSGTRSSTYGPGTPWLSSEQWGSVVKDMKTYFPNSQSTMVWIIGSLSGSGVNLEFERPDWLTDDWLAEKSYRNLDNIKFSEPTKEGHAPHEDYFDYFDQHGITVYLQVESGYSDMRTLMDIIMEQYGHHKCIVGFGVDVEWYWGVQEDLGLPITDYLAKQWNEHLKTLDKNYRLFLKHYNANFLPKSYRSDIIFVNDSQSFGSINGDALGQYDENLDDVLGFIPEFKNFADTFTPNDVIYQIGYKPDRMWYYTLNDSVIQSLGEKLAEATSQNCGIAWVDFTLKDPLTFPQLLTDQTKLSSLKGLIDYFRNAGSNMIGKRFAAGEATYRDALYVQRINSLIDTLNNDEQKALWQLFTSDKDKQALESFKNAQAKAIDILIENLPETLREKDIQTIKDIQAAYDKLTDEQKAEVKGKIPDISNIIKDEPTTPEQPKDEPTTPNKPDVDNPTNNEKEPLPAKPNVKTGDSNAFTYYAIILGVTAIGIYFLNKQRKSHQ